MSHDLLGLMNSMDGHEEERENYIRAPFPWPGAKSRSIQHILPHLPQRAFYGEPFGGSGAVLLSRNSSDLEVFNDRFAGVTCFYRVLRNTITKNQLLDRLELCLHSREEYMWCRDTWKDCVDEVERAARWWYMVMCSFAAQGRHFGRCIKGKSQMGPKLKNNLKMFENVHKRLLHVQIENQDWRQCLKDYDQKDAVWYLDPPYYQYAKGMYECELSKEDHKELLERIFDLKGFVALSGYDNPLYDTYHWNDRYSWTVISTSLAQSFTESNNLLGMEDTIKRGTAREVLWLKEAV